ncbi:MAG: PIG-L family deacetylase, partial [Candidatus Helarchaeota archaeon]|nr:PIG-L family deacetylase [Candidatus Helarchaeota archaeon]
MFQREDFIFYDLSKRTKSKGISIFFPDWQNEHENVMILSPHDDDALLGAGYIIKAAQAFGGKVYVTIFHDGSTGYSEIELKDKIIEIRKKETRKAFEIIQIPSENIYRFEIPDFSGINFLGWKHLNGKEGVFRKIVSNFRRLKITRLIIANGYREHLDHTAVFLSGTFDGVQAGDSISIDWGVPIKIKSYLIYSVWGKFSPQDALITGRKTTIRGNLAIAVLEEVERDIQSAIKEFKSQSQIINYILNARKERKMENGKYLEVYQKINPRPRININPYKKLV